MALAVVEPPEGWGPKQLTLGELERLGYTVVEHRTLGRSVLVFTAAAPARPPR